MENQEAQQTEVRENRQKARAEQVTRKRVVQERSRKRAEKRLRNNIIKGMLAAVLVLQIICAVELFLVLQKADQLMEELQSSQLVQNQGQQERLEGAVSVNGQVTGEADSQSGGVFSGTGGTGDGASVSGSSQVGPPSGEPGQSSGTSDGTAVVPTEEEVPWNLVLVNKWNKMNEGYIPELTELSEGHRIDSRIADDLMDMIHDAGGAGYAIYILSAYRDMDKQVSLYDAEVKKWKNAGYGQTQAEEKAGEVVAVPGTSEHQLGLAVDLVSSEHVKLDRDAEKTKGYQWLVKHCHEYGFILRYPNEATEITGIIYEPWHFRYVGVEAATEIMEAGITLEEYLERQK